MATTGFECAKCGEDRLLIECLGKDAEKYYPTFCPTCGERLKTQKQVEKEIDEEYVTTRNGSVVRRDDTSTLCQGCKGSGCAKCANTGIWQTEETVRAWKLNRANRARSMRR